MTILDPQIDDYLQRMIPKRDAILAEMEQLAAERGFPIVGPLVGRLCYQLVKMTGARRILEMGSGFGYSAYWMAMALPKGGRVIATEASKDNLELAEAFFRRGDLLDWVDLKHGDALEIVSEVNGQFDIIVNDIDKEDYPKSLDLILPKLRHGGVLITDNMLWQGRVIEARDAATQAIVDYTRRLYEHEELYSTIIPLRDGVAISVKGGERGRAV
ncbi:O-methyltransferase [bacterium]|nr:O-methyltransferase [bacterium]